MIELSLKGFIELYLNWGLSIIPLKYQSKVPDLRPGEIVEYRKRQPNQSEINKWWFGNTKHGIAAVLGYNNLFCIDFDEEDEESW